MDLSSESSSSSIDLSPSSGNSCHDSVDPALSEHCDHSSVLPDCRHSPVLSQLDDLSPRSLTRKKPVTRRNRRRNSLTAPKKATDQSDSCNLELNSSHDLSTSQLSVDRSDLNLDSDFPSRHSESYPGSNSIPHHRFSFITQRRKSTPHLSFSIAEEKEFVTSPALPEQPSIIEEPRRRKTRGASVSIPFQRKKSTDSLAFAGSIKNPHKSKRYFSSVDDLWQGSDFGQEIKKSIAHLHKHSGFNKSHYRELTKSRRTFESDESGGDSPVRTPLRVSRRQSAVEDKRSQHLLKRPKEPVRHKKHSLPILWKNVDAEMLSNYQYEGYHCNGSGDQVENGTHAFNKPRDDEKVLFDLLRVSPEEYARQLTLIDWPLFAAITPDEVASCGWVKKDKWEQTPNVCAMTRRFNYTSFWVIHQILNASSLKTRAEIITLFIRVAKRLCDLNNIHSLMAVTQSLNSSSIIRLTQTWASVAKHHRMTFEKLHHLVREDGNRSQLRAHMNDIKLPCIPYLGMYLSDVIYVNSAHPDTGGLGSQERTDKMNNILRVLSEYQQSKYDLQEHTSIKNYLSNVNYIDELQRFVEEDNYKLSLKIEPLTPNSSLNTSRRVKDDPGSASSSSPSLLHQNGATIQAPVEKFGPGHRKTRSLGREAAFGAISLRGKLDHHSRTPKRDSWYSRPRQRDSTVWYLSPTKRFSTENLNFSESLNRGTSNLPSVAITTSLLDDSIIATPNSASSSGNRISVANGNNGSLGSSRSNSGSEFSEQDESSSWDRSLDLSSQEYQTCTFEGCLKRKCMRKQGKKPSMSPWSRYWVCICDNKLVYFAPKSLKATDRHHFKSRPCKAVSILGWMVLYADEPTRLDSFQLSNPDSGDLYQFQCDSKEVALVWIKTLKDAIKGHPQPEKDLINLEDT